MSQNISKNQNVHLVGMQPKYRNKVEAQIIKGLNSAGKIFKYNKKVDVAIFDAEFWDVHPKLSLSAHARVYYIDIKICFYRKDIDISKTLNIDLPLTLHHEFSHVVRANTVGYPETLLDAFIDEGIACFVEQSIMPERKIPYIVKQKNEDKIWQEAKKILTKKISSKLHDEWFFGSGKFPEWIGYRLGFLIVQKYMDKNPIGLDKLVRMKSKDFLD